MTPEYSAVKGLRAAIIGLAKRFLLGFEAGASEEILTSIIMDIKNKELQLIKEEGAMLDPEIWKILQNRLERRTKEIIDTTDYESATDQQIFEERPCPDIKNAPRSRGNQLICGE